jgi:hypothetical protein
MAAKPKAAGAEPAAADASKVKTKTFTLSNGMVVVHRQGFGRDIDAAHRAAQDKSQFALTVAYVAQVITLDGKKVAYEAILDWPSEDVVELLTRTNNGFFVEEAGSAPSAPPSPPRSVSPAPAT